MQVFRYGDNPALGTIANQANTAEGAPQVPDTLVGVSRWADTARNLVRLHSGHENTVILEGEPGSGKKHLARLIHRFSDRHERPFVVLSLGSISDDVARQVLFGSTSDSSIDAQGGEQGLAELARGGTLYIEGLSKAESSLTDDIIRLAHKQYLNLEHEKPVRVLLGRVIQTDNSRSPRVNLRAFNQLDFEVVQVPALRDRPDDIEPLTEYFIRELCQRFGKEPRKVSTEVMAALHAYDWPRNVSELKTLISQLVKQSSPPAIEAKELPAYLSGPSDNTFFPAAGLDLEDEVKRIEVGLIRAALKQSHGYQNRAAQLLRLKPTTLFMKIRRYGIDVEGFKRAS